MLTWPLKYFGNTKLKNTLRKDMIMTTTRNVGSEQTHFKDFASDAH